MVNARLDKAGSSAWKSMWKKGRVLVPADGCYEWIAEEGIAEEGNKQPYYIQPIDGQPLFFAGLTSTTFGMEPREGETYGFVIITDASAGGMLDVHDRRPLALSSDEARQWLDPDTPYETATHLANNAVTRPENFRWFRVSPAVNKIGNNEPSFNQPLDETI
jgi:putative SOS response-associated peptidase YedK